MWKKFYMKIGGFVKNAPSYLPAQFDSNKSLYEEVIFLANHNFCPQITECGVYMLIFFWKLSIFQTCEKSFQ